VVLLVLPIMVQNIHLEGELALQVLDVDVAMRARHPERLHHFAALDGGNLKIALNQPCKASHAGDDRILVPIEGDLDGQVDRVFFVKLELEVLAEVLLQLVEGVRKGCVVQLFPRERANKRIDILLAIVYHDN
jgi:hypothetical protein